MIIDITKCPICGINTKPYIIEGLLYYCNTSSKIDHLFTNISASRTFIIFNDYKTFFSTDNKNGGVYLRTMFGSNLIETIDVLDDKKVEYYLDYLKGIELFQ